VDRLIEAAAKAVDDGERRALYVRAQRLIADDVPYISLWYKTNIAVFGTNVEGVTLTPTAEFTFLRNVSKRNHPAAGAGE
jgi:peptide/nickel transport system substrate-binding protein